MLASLLMSAIVSYLAPSASPSQKVDSFPAALADSAEAKQGEARMQMVVCLGDSITAGARLSQAQHTAWPNQLRDRLNYILGYERIHVEQLGVGGATLLRTGDRPIWKTQAFERLQELDVDHIVVMLGTNDTVQEGRGNWAKAEAWEDDLAALVAAVRKRRPQANVLLTGPPPIFPNQPGLQPERSAALSKRAPRLVELQARTAAFAASHAGVDYLDLNGVLLSGRTTDGVHPNEFGQEAIARAVHAALASKLGVAFDTRDSMQPAPSAEYRAGAGWQGGSWADAFARLETLGIDHSSSRLIFFGDSITQSLTGDTDRVSHAEGKRAIDQVFGVDGALSLGLSGDRTEHLRYRLRMGALHWLSPRVIVLQIGINNLNSGKHSAADTAAGIRAVVDDLRTTQPWASILVCGPFPAGRTPDSSLRLAVDAVHDVIADLGAGTESEVHGGAHQVRYLDLRPLFLNQDGSPGPGMAGDALHINGQGQMAWMRAIEPWVREQLDRPLAPGLPAELGWLIQNSDQALVSRSLMTLTPGAQGMRRRAQPVLYSFDTSDQLELGFAAGAWVLNGPISQVRSAPNVGTPLQVVRSDGSRFSSNISASKFATDPGSSLVAYAHIQSLGIYDISAGLASELLGAEQLGRTMPRSLHWLPTGKILLDLGTVAGGTIGTMRSGLWSIDPKTGTSERLGDSLGDIRSVLDARALLVSRLALTPGQQGSSSYAARELLLRDLNHLAAAPISITAGLRAKTGVAALDDGSFAWVDGKGQLRRSAGLHASAALREQLAEPPVLATSERGVLEVVACQDWLAYSSIDPNWQRQLFLLHLGSGRRYALGPGLSPCFAAPDK
jgi:lysophospholipase L1-like esterase